MDMGAAFFAAAVDVAFPMISRYAMYDLLPDQAYQAFFAVMAIVAGAYLMRSLANYIMTYWGHTFGVRVETDMRSALFSHLQELDFAFYDKNRTGKLMSRLTGDLFEITELAHHGPEDILIGLVTIVGALCFMFAIQWKLALVVALLVPIFLFIVVNRRKDMSNTSTGVKVKLGEVNASIESSISGIKTSKAFANEGVDQERFSQSNHLYRDAKKGYYKAMALFVSSQEFFLCIIPVAVIAFGGRLIMLGELHYIDLVTFTLFVTTFINPVRKLTNFAEIFANGIAGLKRFQEVMAIKPQIQEEATAQELVVTQGRIVIQDASFAYEDHREVIEDLNLGIQPGETVAIVGQSGGGKTTLCQLLPRFYDVTTGSIAIDGVDVRKVTLKSLRQQIGIVQQDVFIFADTIYENIRYGRPDATYQEVVEAAQKAEIYQDIMAMPQGFDTYVGERGTRLSGGQKQRLSIARIFLKNPPILILDEATSALDTVTEEAIQESFHVLAQNRTSLVIAHRLSTVRDADRILVMEKGHIVEEGTHETLLQQGGAYARLYCIQDTGNKCS